MEKYLAIVTGGAQGIGLAITEALLKTGGKVHFLDVNEVQGRKTEKELREKYGEGNVTFVKCDVGKPDQLDVVFRAAKREMGGLNVVCNNAGFGRPFYDTSRWQEEVDVNLKGSICGTMLGLELMGVDRGGEGGTIINTSSLTGINPVPLFPTYCATKAGVLAYMRSMMPFAAVSKVRINCVCPDATDTPQFRATLPELGATLSQEKFKSFMQTMSSGGEAKQGITTLSQTPEAVAEGVMDLIRDETKNGVAMVMSKNLGNYPHNF